MWRLFGVVSLIIGSFIPETKLLGDEKSGAARDTVCLTCREVSHVDNIQFPLPLLGRELVRQAFLIAARDECGLFTRDATLREDFPASAESRAVPLDMYSYAQTTLKGLDYCYILSGTQGKSPETIWKWRYHLDDKDHSKMIKSPQSIATLVEQSEALARSELRELLKQMGCAKSVAAARASAPLPAKAEEMIWEWNELAVLGGLRQVHAEIRTGGESPELLAALALGYANLGMLSQGYNSPAHKAFSARALLYAERLLRRTDGSSWALWHRAYVRAVVGLHNLAAVDIETAKQRQSKSKGSPPLPFWSEIIQAYCQGQMPAMLAAAMGRSQQRLARYLFMESTSSTFGNDLRIKAAQAVVQECGDCFRAWDATCSTHAIGAMAAVTGRSFQLLSNSIQQRVPELPGLAEPIAKRVREHRFVRGPADEIPFRCQLVQDLKEAGNSGGDKGEPSLAVVGQLIEEIELKQALRRLDLERFRWAVRTEETIATFRPLFEKHRYAALAELYSTSTPDVLKAAADLAGRIDPGELTENEAEPLRMAQALGKLDAKRTGYWQSVICCHADPVIRDLLNGLGAAAGKSETARFGGFDLEILARTSSKFPAAVAAQIARNWVETKARAADLEKEFSRDPIVLTALMKKYNELKEYDAAERCAKKRIEIFSDYSSYWMLAAIYRAKGETIRWKETLEKSLEFPAQGLEHSQVRNAIARYYMGRKEWQLALPYAEAAAESYAEWALESDARCHEMLGNWKKAESLMRAISERYEGAAFKWMLWCHRTGHGDARAAAALAQRHFESLGAAATPVQLQEIGVYYLLRKEPQKALTIFENAYARSKNVYDAMHAALIADTLDNVAQRDAHLAQIIRVGSHRRPKTVTGLYARLAQLMKQSLPPGTIKQFDFEQLDQVLDDAAKRTPRTDTNLKYFVGVFLKNRREAVKSQHYLLRSAQTSQYTRPNQTLACELLREMKISFIPLGDEKSPADASEADP